MNEFREAVAWLERRGIFPDRPPSLEPMHRALRRAGLARRIDPARVIIVAGTNGKGSTCAFLEALLRGRGARVGLYTSPHLVRITERFRVDGQDISESRFTEAYARRRPVIEEEGLSHFEALTLMAAELFAEENLDWMIFEVGLGGLWDATNAIPHRHVVLTPIDYDHENLLGRSLAEIARNKFGVVTEGARVSHAPLDPSLAELRAETERRTRSEWHPCLPWECGVRSDAEGEPRFTLRCAGAEVALPMPGRRAAENAALALSAYAQLGGDAHAAAPALAHARWRGRMERVAWPGGPGPLYLSGDHNPHGVRSLREILTHWPAGRWHILAGVGRDKDHAGILETLGQIPGARIYLTETPFKGRRLDEYGEWRAKAAGAWADPREALSRIARDHARPGERTLVTGSLYLVGAVLESLGA